MMRDDEDELDDKDDPRQEDMDPPESDDDATVACPYCGNEIYEGAEQCPRCRRYINEEDTPRRPSRWLIVGAILVAACVLTWVFSRR